MGRTYDAIDDALAAFLGAQHVFFVATAPLAADGRVNLSPKGLGGFAVLGPHSVAYLDLTGSGVETIAHVRENGRITLMFCAFEGPPRIVRLSGRGRVVTTDAPAFRHLAPRFPDHLGTRPIGIVDLDRIAVSCGFGVPLYRYEGERRQLIDWAERKGADGLLVYHDERNAESIDGLPGLPSARRK